MPDQTRIVASGPSGRTVRTADGQIMHAPADWELLPPGDATLTRRVKAAGPTWTVQVKKILTGRLDSGRPHCGERPQWSDEKVIGVTSQIIEKGGGITYDVPIQ